MPTKSGSRRAPLPACPSRQLHPSTIQPELQHLSAARRYLIGVSGGRDSVALLHFLYQAGFKKLVVCHLDHSLRGRQSTGDARFVAKLAAGYGLESKSAKVDVRKLAKQQKLSIETAARRARHEFFADLGGSLRCRQVILGHHADDRVESTLINLFRGSGKLTLPRSPSVIRVGRRSLTFLRPLYPVWRSEIDAYIEIHSLAFREDASNAETDVTRNRVRHELIPLLDDIFARDVAKIVARASLIASEEDEYLQTLLQDLDLGNPRSEMPSAISTSRLAALPLTLQRRAIHDWLKSNAISKISFDNIDACLSLLDTSSGPAKINLPGKRHARRRNKSLFIE